MRAAELEIIHNQYMSESSFNADDELTFGAFKLVYSIRKGMVTYIYSKNQELINTFPEFEYTSEKGKEAKVIYNEELFIKLVNYIR